MKKLLLVGACFLAAGSLHAQTITDGLMMPKNTLCTGFLAGQDQWKNYWEGGLKRENQNVGTLTSQSITWMGTYGLSKKVNIIAMLPYIKNSASGGTLLKLSGIQDLTIAAKYNFLTKEINKDKFKLFATGVLSTPLTNYTPDLLPLSIGLQSTNLSGRFTANYNFNHSWYLNGSAAYTWRSNISLDRPSYYTDGQLFLTNKVQMHDVFDFIVDAGYHKNALQAEVYFTVQNTLGGGDIRRQDMPFASNRMNASKVGALIFYYLPWPANLAVRATGSYVVAGRNVGQSTSLMAGFMYTFYFKKDQEKTLDR
jgi:hypothetical protein